MRDMMRFVESSGAKVVGLMEGDGFHDERHGLFDHIFPEAKLQLPELPPANSIHAPDELMGFVQLTKSNPELFIQSPGIRNGQATPASRGTYPCTPPAR
jgi:hypothetical protein